MESSTTLTGQAAQVERMPSPYRKRQTRIFPASGKPRALDFILYEDVVTLPIIADEMITIGRTSEYGAVDLDLSAYEARQQGVSRLHAHIQTIHDRTMVRDNDSTNHTYLNDFELLPQKWYRLYDGDMLLLGRFEITVRFVL